VGPWSEAVARRLPGLERVECLDFPYFDRRPKGPPWRPYLRMARAAAGLRGRFDAALVLRDDDRWSAALCRLAGIPLRLSHADPRTRRHATHWLVEARRPAHVAAANLALVDLLLSGEGARLQDSGSTTRASEATPPGPTEPFAWPLSFRLEEADRLAAEALLAELPAPARWDPRGPIALHPGSGSVIKRWRPGAWAEAISALCAPGEPVILTGGPSETGLTAAIARLSKRPVLDLAGRTELGALAAIQARCRLVIGPDSGPLHLAVAMGRPSLHLYGPAAAGRFGPWGDPERHRVLASGLPCAPCGRLDWPDPADHPCLRIFSVDEVVAAARSCEALGRHL
jgi:heptosyltransferase-2/heptosyltransferase-3